MEALAQSLACWEAPRDYGSSQALGPGSEEMGNKPSKCEFLSLMSRGAGPGEGLPDSGQPAMALYSVRREC